MGLIFNEETAKFKQSPINYERALINNENQLQSEESIEQNDLFSEGISETGLAVNPALTNSLRYTFLNDSICTKLYISYNGNVGTSGLSKLLTLKLNQSVIFSKHIYWKDTDVPPTFGFGEALIELENVKIKKNDILTLTFPIGASAGSTISYSCRFYGYVI